MYKDLLGNRDVRNVEPYKNDLITRFRPQGDLKVAYSFIIEGLKKPLYVGVSGANVEAYYAENEAVDVIIKIRQDMFDDILAGKLTFQRAFMTGAITAKGNFKILRLLDDMFLSEQLV
jgi:putative sterol carrier protein